MNEELLLDLFAESRRARNAKCKEKDKATVPMMETMRVEDPKKFWAIIMPCRYGPELTILPKRGVPSEQIFAIERDRSNWRYLRTHTQIRTTNAPMDANTAIDYIQAENAKFNLIYLDFFSMPSTSHIELLEKIFKLDGGMLAPKSKLILTFGRTRCHETTRMLANMFQVAPGMPTKAYVDMMLRKTGHRKYSKFHATPYQSPTGNTVLRFVVSEFFF